MEVNHRFESAVSPLMDGAPSCGGDTFWGFPVKDTIYRVSRCSRLLGMPLKVLSFTRGRVVDGKVATAFSL